MKKKIVFILIISIILILGYNTTFAGHSGGCYSSNTDIRYISNGTGTHTVKVYCDDCGGYLYQSTGSCSGGSATCTSLATCKDCKGTYGGYGGHNDNAWGSCTGKKCSVCTRTTGYYSHGGGTHANGGKCTNGCGKYYQTHSQSSTVSSYNTTTTTHTPVYSCTYSGCSGTYTGSASSHSGGEATCTAQAECSTCSTPYGNTKSHSWYVTGAYNADLHNRACDNCGTTDRVAHAFTSPSCKTNSYCMHEVCGWELYNTALGHTGGTHANGGKCTRAYCNTVYQSHGKSSTISSYDTTATQHTPRYACTQSGCSYTYTGTASDHSWNTSHICTVCSYTGTHDYSIESDSYYPCRSPEDEHQRDYYCVCGSMRRFNFKHTYAKESGTHHYCIYCNARFRHNWTSYTYADSSNHSMSCANCSATSTEAHNSDTRVANCTQKPICSLCNSEWGSINSSNHNYTKTCTKCNTGSVVCSRSNSHVKSHDCSIYVNEPSVTTIHRYTGSSITGVPSGNGYTLSGIASATNVGTYTATATLTPGSGPTYRWSDTGTTEERSYTWSILDTAVSITSQPSAGATKEGGTVTFSVGATGSHIRYQWYYNTSGQSTGGTAISGATSSSYTTTAATRDMNNRYYYCVLSNNSSSSSSLTSTATSAAKLTVWWTHEIAAHPADINVKKGETASFSITPTGGNPSTYTYQWYSATSETAAGSVISGATNSTYSFVPSENISGRWYYCSVSNGQYTLTSNRAKLVADVTIPTLNAGSASITHANVNTQFTVPIIVTDTGEGFNTTTFTSGDIVVKVNGVSISPSRKDLAYNSNSGNNYTYTLTLQGLTGDGVLTLEVASGNIADNFGNTNATTSMVVGGIVIDNTPPVIASNGAVTGTNQGFINSEDTITIPVKITDVGGLNPSEFTGEDVIVNLGATEDTGAKVTVTYVGQTGNDYEYIITVENLTGEGELTLEIADGKIVDFATNGNLETVISGLNVTVDNTKPKVTSITLSLGGYNSSNLYPGSLPRENDSWINEDVYAVINSVDEGVAPSGVETYWRSVENPSSFIQLPNDREIWSNEMNNTVYYRVVDKAGNVSENASVLIKIDKTSPIVAELNMRHNREGGLVYNYDILDPASNSIYIKPYETQDTGTYQSGILKSEYIITFNDGAVTEVSDVIDGTTHTILQETGTYTIEVITTDRAGNTSNKFFNAIIEKKVENTVKIKNIHDKGSGVKQITITARKEGATADAIAPIVINNPGANITERIKLTDGTFTIKVEIVDGVGLTTVLEQVITNNIS